MQRNAVLLGAATLMAFGLMAGAAQAVPYAYASNQITGLTVQLSNGTGTQSLVPFLDTRTTGISDSATFSPFGGTTYANAGIAGDALNVTQAYSGPGPAPAENTFGQAPAFTGSRSDAALGAGGVSSGGVSVSNVAEAYGITTFGTATSGNTATINFTIDITVAGMSIQLDFVDAYMLEVSSLSPSDSANAKISNTFSINSADGSTQFFSYQPAEIQRSISSQSGIPPNGVISGTYTGFAMSGPLAIGQYNIQLNSGAAVNIQGQPVPEPATLALLGSALIGLGLVRRRRASRS